MYEKNKRKTYERKLINIKESLKFERGDGDGLTTHIVSQ